jgi:hypothetical protein
MKGKKETIALPLPTTTIFDTAYTFIKPPYYLNMPQETIHLLKFYIPRDRLVQIHLFSRQTALRFSQIDGGIDVSAIAEWPWTCLLKMLPIC